MRWSQRAGNEVPSTVAYNTMHQQVGWSLGGSTCNHLSTLKASVAYRHQQSWLVSLCCYQEWKGILKSKALPIIIPIAKCPGMNGESLPSWIQRVLDDLCSVTSCKTEKWNNKLEITFVKELSITSTIENINIFNCLLTNLLSSLHL